MPGPFVWTFPLGGVRGGRCEAMPSVLQQLMRHEDITTTLKYYVGQDAEAMADVLYAAVGKHKPAEVTIEATPTHSK